MCARLYNHERERERERERPTRRPPYLPTPEPGCVWGGDRLDSAAVLLPVETVGAEEGGCEAEEWRLIEEL